MPDYRLFGGVLRSDIELLHLSPSPTEQPWWTLTRVGEAAPGSAGDPLGTEEVEPGVQVTLYHAGDCLRLVFDDTGVFEISADGRHITWTPPPNPDMDAVCKDVLSRVFAVALHQEDFLTFHGSAVALGDAAVAFLAPKFHGKSTTAAALVNSGGRFLADDLVAVCGRYQPVVVPAAPVLQLWNDAAVRVGGAPTEHSTRTPKLRMTCADPTDENSRHAPLAAVYLLAPGRPDGAAQVKRERLSAVPAALGLLGQSKIGALVGTGIRMALLARMVDLAERVPVYRLDVPRDLDRISELTAQLWSWHESSLVPVAAGRAS